MLRLFSQGFSLIIPSLTACFSQLLFFTSNRCSKSGVFVISSYSVGDKSDTETTSRKLEYIDENAELK